MKSFRIDDTAAASSGSIERAMLNASKRKRSRKDVQRRLAKMEETIATLQVVIEERNYNPRHHEAIVINENGPHKERQIIKPDYFPEQIMHHVAVQALHPCIMHGMGAFVLGSIPGRGAHYGKRYQERGRHGRVPGEVRRQSGNGQNDPREGSGFYGLRVPSRPDRPP